MSTATSPVETVFSGFSSTTSISSSTYGSRGHPCTTLSELIISEAHYLSTLKRVGNALNLASNQSFASGRKTSNVVRALVERWTTMMRIHIKFHDDVVATKEDVRGTTQLLNNLLLTLEPVLVDHGRDLSNAVYKLSRNDKRSGHTPAEWDVALRHPFDHLTIYNEWLQRVDPHGQFNGPCLTQLNNLVLNVKAVIEAHQNPRGMLKRLSTFARTVMKRPSSPQLSHSYSQDSNATSPTTPTTVVSVSARGITHVGDKKASSTHKGSLTRGASMDIPRATTAATPGATVTPTTAATMVSSSPSENRIETVADTVASVTTVVLSNATLTESPASSPKSVAHANRAANGLPPRHPNRTSVARSFARSNVSSVGSLTLAPSSESLHMKAAIAAYTHRPNGSPERQFSSVIQRQKFLEEREARKATLRMGAQAFIVAKTDSLQQRSPTFVSRPSIDRLRTITKREVETKPPVKSLINFWEQATEPIEC
ncbi:hypothetical protein EC957_007302 [Mortierella hygrophila]|uniref:DH domain-containing protein n=1 Tax=Mortierella hygrophila TaxID=979708 RepID=A0A9P6K6B4_9FUNG|nr:hypothetical protein EC957_007302 [Mortierella hygrophila]